tara:strand:- start:195 stop:923 length:729 start_codon:yes stop_codon:yes gene_type:complete
MKFINLSSTKEANEWIQQSVAECKSSYPLVNQKLPVAVDIGANIGGFCIHAHQHFDKIYAFEPHLQNYNILLQVKEHLKMSNVDVYNMAITNQSNEKRVLKAHEGAHSKDISCADFNNDDWRFKDLQETCETISLADMMGALNLKRINYLKLDCEGSEYEILENFHDYDKISIIVMEIHGFFGFERKKNLLLLLNQSYWMVPVNTNEKIEVKNIHKYALKDFDSIDSDKTNFFCLNRAHIQT